MDNETAEKGKVHDIVREAYAKRVKGESSGSCSGCCVDTVPSAATERAAEHMGYSKDDIENAPKDSNLGLGCGAPLSAAALKSGDTVLDLGSGAGFDAFLAARVVGTSGKVIGVDMTPEMVEKAKANATKHNYENVDFRLGKIEDLPVDNGTVDVIISNCVINLSPDKPAVFREAFRVLKPGGRIAVSDICVTKDLPTSVKANLAAYVGCIAGASKLEDYQGYMRQAGLVKIEANTRAAFDVLACDDPVVLAAIDGLKEEGIDPETMKDAIVSATIVAYKE